MELDAECRVLPVRQRHHLALGTACRHLERTVVVDLDDQRMVPAGPHRVRHSRKDPRSGMEDLGGATMHGRAGMADTAAEGRSDALVAEADAEDRDVAR